MDDLDKSDSSDNSGNANSTPPSTEPEFEFGRSEIVEEIADDPWGSTSTNKKSKKKKAKGKSWSD